MTTSGYSAQPPYAEGELLDIGLDRLRALLGPQWDIQPQNHGVAEPANMPALRRGPTSVYALIDPNHTYSGPILVEAREHLSPADITRHLEPRIELMQQLTGDAAILIVSPWLSPRTRQQLDELKYGYLDLSGNVSFRLNRPGVVLRLDGARQSPSPQVRSDRHLKGDKAGILVRALVDVPPPHRVTDLAAATHLSLAYVSRLLDTMESEALITRDGRLVAGVDWTGLIRARSATYNLLRANPPTVMVAPRGVNDTLLRLASNITDVETFGRVAVTGPVAATEVAPLTIGGQLMIHVEHLDEARKQIGKALGLLPAADGGNVLLLRTSTPSAFIGRRWQAGVPHVALSQLALDCLGGSGRMPAEGEAILKVMTDQESRWRISSLRDWSTGSR